MSDNLKWDDLWANSVHDTVTMSTPKFDTARMLKTMKELMEKYGTKDPSVFKVQYPKIDFKSEQLGSFPAQSWAAGLASKPPPAPLPTVGLSTSSFPKCLHCGEDEYAHVDRHKCLFGPETFAVGVYMERPVSDKLRSWTCKFCNRTSYRTVTEGPPARCTKCGCPLKIVPRPPRLKL